MVNSRGVPCKVCIYQHAAPRHSLDASLAVAGTEVAAAAYLWRIGTGPGHVLLAGIKDVAKPPLSRKTKASSWVYRESHCPRGQNFTMPV